jgi:hypothetical protein
MYFEHKLLIFKVFFLIIIVTIVVMICNKFSFYGLFAPLICLLQMLCIQNVYAASWGTVIVQRAIIYSDIQMTSVIGYVKQGRKVRVGDIPKNKGRLLPIIVNKKVAYIQRKDLNTGIEVESLKTVSERIKDRINQKKGISRFGIKGTSFYGALIQNDFEDSFGNELLFFGYGLTGYYTHISSETGFRVSVEKLVATKDDATFTIYSVPISYNIYGFQTSKYDFNFYLGGIFMPYTEFKLGGDFKVSGQGVGAEIGAEMRFSFSTNYSLHIAGDYQVARFISMELPENNVYPKEFDPYIHGVKLSASITYEF